MISQQLKSKLFIFQKKITIKHQILHRKVHALLYKI